MTRVPAGTAGVERHAEDGAVGIQVFDDYPALVERRRIRPRHLSLRHRRHTTAADQPAYATTPGAEAPAFTAAIESRAPPTAGSTAASQLRLVRLGVRPQLAAGKRRLNRQREVCDESSDGGSRCETMWIDVRSALAYLEIARGWSIGSSSGFSGGAEAGCRNCTVSCFAPAGRTGASPPPLRR